MQDFHEQITITLSGKTRYAMIAFLEKHHADSHDLSHFIEDAITWRLMDLEMSFLHAPKGEEANIFARPAYEKKAVGAEV